ncbi:hypothetical protein [Desertivirga brevis]|uniref:hypothetical protein n=1 Tax=Desertivirga brevis TaxID=2810310 RepID=UPI001A96497E|nr:hypothetical protein [Pedobacter sp. SYSU D00873]
MKILVFKTNVRRQEQISKLKALLSPVLSILEWNVDLKDRDKILRIVTNGLPPVFIESLLETSGIYCEELED